MRCPRYHHFVRFNPQGTVSRCGHMIGAPEFQSLEEMNNSTWLYNITHDDEWPRECSRCRESEELGHTSIRQHSIELHQQQTVKDYLLVGGILDNVCNSGCLTCSPECSTKIGSLISNDYPRFDNYAKFRQLPQSRIVQLDINGGEPSASKNYSDLLDNLPENLTSIRLNTNCSRVLFKLRDIQDSGIAVTVTVSLDGIGDVHDLVRWPIRWENFYRNLMIYREMGLSNFNTWTTVSALNIGDLDNIIEFTQQHHIDHSYAFLHQPEVLNVRYKNHLTLPHQGKFGIVATGENNQVELDKFLQRELSLRGIK